MGILTGITTCVLSTTHRDEVRFPKREDGSVDESASYQVCLDCGRAERTVGVLLGEGKQKIPKKELLELERFGYEVDAHGTIAVAGIKKGHVGKYKTLLREKTTLRKM